MRKRFLASKVFSSVAALCLFAGCASSNSGVTGAAAGDTAKNANTKIERCSQTLGTLSFYEDQSSSWYSYLTRDYQLGSTVPVLRILAQQTGCFVIVERGRSMDNMMQERALEASGELRKGSKFHKGQVVAADYTMQPEITFSKEDTGGISGLVGAVFGNVAGKVSGGFSKSETQTSLLLIDNRSGVQIAGAVGSDSNFDFFGMGSNSFSRVSAGLGGYTKTPEGRMIVNAFMDAMNQLIVALKDYKVQNVKGGLGKGGNIKIGD